MSAARGSFDDVLTALETTTTALVPERQAEQAAQHWARDIAAYYEQKQPEAQPAVAASTGPILVLAADGKGINMRRAHLRSHASRVDAGIRRSATLQGLTGPAREAADTCADYLLKYKQYLRYDKYLAAGYPIATGGIEGNTHPMAGLRHAALNGKSLLRPKCDSRLH